MLPAVAPILLVVLACGLDRLLGDPRSWLHPVMVMGWVIARLRGWAEAWAADEPWRLRLAGFGITLLLVGGSALAGWGVERLAIHGATSGVSAAALHGSLVLAVRIALKHEGGGHGNRLNHGGGTARGRARAEKTGSVCVGCKRRQRLKEILTILCVEAVLPLCGDAPGLDGGQPGGDQRRSMSARGVELPTRWQVDQEDGEDRIPTQWQRSHR